MNRKIRLATGNKVKIIDRESPHFGKTGTLIEPRQVPDGLRLVYKWLVKLDGTETTEIFAFERLEKIS
jgi:hypothetical protein